MPPGMWNIINRERNELFVIVCVLNKCVFSFLRFYLKFHMLVRCGKSCFELFLFKRKGVWLKITNVYNPSSRYLFKSSFQNNNNAICFNRIHQLVQELWPKENQVVQRSFDHFWHTVFSQKFYFSSLSYSSV